MTDLEDRLSEALHGAAGAAPRGGSLAEGARVRLRRRRRTTLAAVAAVLVVLAVPVGLRLASSGAEPQVTTASPDGWRTESYRDLTLRVPADWGYDGWRDWCLGDGRPAVTRVEGGRTGAGCEPRLTYGVQFRDVPPEAFPEPGGVPDDAVLERVGTGGTSAWVVAQSEEQLTAILASVRQIDGVDANGCPPVVDPDAEGSGDRVSVCRYDSGALEQSELLSVEDSEALARAVSATQSTAAIDYDLVCPPYSLRQPVVTLRSAAVEADLLPSSACSAAGAMLVEGQERLVTEDVLYWALSPGWEGAGGGLPLPDPLRG
jgi:hypothetical protein